jgi:hypothetical protein
MVKVCNVILVLVLFAGYLYSEVVINEILYDPIGTDTGNEWIELYNDGAEDINLEGARLQVAGSAFTTVFTFPSYVLRAGRFVLIGEPNITQAAFITNLVMQNGGAETDAVRYVSPDGTYTDTVLYDSPNANNLTDDFGNVANSFAPDVPAGYSLARTMDGRDSNYCQYDFIAEQYPTPGLPNRIPVDYAIEYMSLALMGEGYTLHAEIHNVSMAYSDTIQVSLVVSLNDNVINTLTINPIPPWEYHYFSEAIDLYSYAAGLVKAEVVVFGDINPDNNFQTLEIGNPTINPMFINEIMYDPATGEQEWIELYIPLYMGWQYSFLLSDAAGNTISATLPSLSPEYLVLCRDQADLVLSYPACPPDNIMQVSTLPALNNEGDILRLIDGYGVVIDSMSYVGVSSKKGISLERQVAADSTVSWQYCRDEAGATPGQPNSIAPPPPQVEQGKIRLTGSPFNPAAGESMKLEYNFTDASNTISCYVYDMKGRKVHTVASGLEIGKSGELAWNGKNGQGKPFPRGIYVLMTEARNSSKNIILRKQLTVVLATN